MWCWLIFFYIHVLTAQTQRQSESKIVSIAQGEVRGYKEPEHNVFAFYDIPYATVSERFKTPSAPPTWNQTFEAVRRGIICPQTQRSSDGNRDIMLNRIMQEDCLVAHVFIPNTGERNLPVMVNVHGGAFQTGSGVGDTYKTLVEEKNIIAVSFNYRVGVFGFLCLGTKGAPGNAGLKDQLALLRWVKENIASFGGNPDDVTFAGCSAGSASVDILTLSKTTKGLFNKVILNSGAHLGVFAVQGDPIRNAKVGAQLLNFQNVNELNTLEEFYKNASMDLLASRSFANNKDASVYFSPCVEKDLGEEAILLDAPYNILNSGEFVRYPTIYGFTDLEGILRMSFFDTWSEEMNEHFSDFLPGDLKFENEQQREEVAQSVKQFYFGDDRVGPATILSYLDYFSDVKFIYAMMRSVKIYAQAGNASFYLHKYTFTDENNPLIPFTNVTGANHCAQALAVRDQDENLLTEQYRNTKKMMRDLWGNFIKSGTPVIEHSPVPLWPIADVNRSPHLSVGRTVELKGIPVEDRTRFWDDIYDKYYHAPIPPSTDSASVIKTFHLIHLLIITYLLS